MISLPFASGCLGSTGESSKRGVADFRLACFRDDVVFVVLLYQRWIYRVDHSRVNEYGQVNEGMVEPVGEKGEKVESKKDK